MKKFFHIFTGLPIGFIIFPFTVMKDTSIEMTFLILFEGQKHWEAIDVNWIILFLYLILLYFNLFENI